MLENNEMLVRYISSERVEGVPDSFYETIDYFEPELQKAGISNARKVAAKLLLTMSRQYGGRTFYVPNLKRLANLARQHEILNDYYRRKLAVPDIAKKHRMTSTGVYTIIRSKPLPDEQ
ncbi:hypothetical protein LJ649_001164 [Salmonella enterica]|uniref:Mor transcription activator domain-containing protein n=1 Tax=Salmonella enterica TaxID=28901 RepID=A0A402TQH9_SALER|nr:hypothetical protein [Salmonella enterica]EBB0361655.1 hypothetical protein [Salmonella enterica subsp. enterica serovar Rubislaw]ECT9310210.1 hypothetical protein [Salmonella enterica subsp. enterica serovar Montevideo]EDR4827258.1 hypothetical protein [Salmonella enterica subsp. enterica serovar Miami]EDR5009754.1 hypothetical protein [Salmonella enterica subsp. enterica serovar Gaminara]EDW6993485.1 hypothetical protein [Salmonella enterica subsp. enterica serovar Braenderup]